MFGGIDGFAGIYGPPAEEEDEGSIKTPSLCNAENSRGPIITNCVWLSTLRTHNIAHCWVKGKVGSWCSDNGERVGTCSRRTYCTDGPMIMAWQMSPWKSLRPGQKWRAALHVECKLSEDSFSVARWTGHHNVNIIFWKCQYYASQERALHFGAYL